MLGPGRYSQWRSRFLRYIDTKPNGEGLRKSILSGPYVKSIVLVQVVAATEGVPTIQQHTIIKTVLNMTPENKEHFLSEKEAFFLLLTGIRDDIYSTVDACKTANEMWITIEKHTLGDFMNFRHSPSHRPPRTLPHPHISRSAPDLPSQDLNDRSVLGILGSLLPVIESQWNHINSAVFTN
ncbi:hypothetical protein Tco_0234436 [Tanacetum coccineum]